MRIAIVTNEIVGQIGGHWELFPNVSFPLSGPEDDFLQEHSAMRVRDVIPFNPSVEKVVSCPPFIVDGCVQTVVAVPLTTEELAANQAAGDQALYDGIVTATQARLDDFARSRGYDSILSACTYATSSVVKFATEGQYCVDARDATWSALLTMLAEVQAGTRTKPAGYADIEPELPALVWP